MFTRINLYKNCILSARNTEVFRNRTILEEYLATLDKPYTTDIDLANVYTTLSGTITIDTTLLNGDFNYIKFEEYDDNNTIKQTVYAFIDSFRIVNDFLVINYSVDVWHTYIGKWTLRKGMVLNSYRTIDGEPYERVLPYIYNDSNQFLSKSMHWGDTHPVNMCILVKYQLYDLASGGDNKPIVEEGYAVYNFWENLDNSFTYKPLYSIESVCDILDSILAKQPEKKWGSGLTTIGFYNKYINFPEVYVIPADWLNNTGLFESTINTIDSTVYYDIWGDNPLYFNKLDYSASFKYRAWHSTLQDFYIGGILEVPKKQFISFGTYTQQIPYVFDGINQDISVFLSFSKDNFGIYLSHGQTYTEITSCFEMIQDYQVVQADVLAQREIARKQQTVQGITGIINHIAQIGVGLAQMGAGLPAVPYTTANSPLDAFGIPIPQTMSKSPTSIAQGGGNVVGGITGIINDVVGIQAANANKYKTFESANNYTNAIINAYYGICIKVGKDWEIVNKNESDNADIECGYSVSYITDNLDIDNNSTTLFNSIRFGFVRLTGLSTEICEAIAKILTDGVKIWYTKNV